MRVYRFGSIARSKIDRPATRFAKISNSLRSNSEILPLKKGLFLIQYENNEEQQG